MNDSPGCPWNVRHPLEPKPPIQGQAMTQRTLQKKPLRFSQICCFQNSLSVLLSSCLCSSNIFPKSLTQMELITNQP